MSSDTTNIDWDRVSYVTNSRYRRLVLDELSGQPSTPTTISRRADEDLGHVSRAIQELRSKGLVELLVDEDRKKGRVYGLTPDGDRVRAVIKERGRP